MTVPQYPPKRPQPSGEMVQLQIHIVGNGPRAIPFFAHDGWERHAGRSLPTKKPHTIVCG